MKIACVGYLHGAGGAERQIIMLANELSKRKHEVHLIVLVENKSKYEIEENVNIHDLTVYECNGKNRIINRYNILKKELKKIKPDISIHYWLQSAYLCSFMKKKISGKIIYSERGNPGDAEYNGMLGVVRSMAFNRVAGFVFQTEGAKNYFKRHIQKKSVIICNSVDIPKDKYKQPCACREKKIVSVGRLHHQKNQKILIEAFSKITKEFPDYTLDIYGDGILREELQNQINRLGLEDKIILHHSTRDILDYVYTASLFVLTSDYEGMPNALMEAMALGVPCISTDCRPGGARFLIEDGINGWIVPVNNPNLLADKMKVVLSHVDNMEAIIKEGIKIRTRFSNEEVFDSWEEFCQQVNEKGH